MLFFNSFWTLWDKFIAMAYFVQYQQNYEMDTGYTPYIGYSIKIVCSVAGPVIVDYSNSLSSYSPCYR